VIALPLGVLQAHGLAGNVVRFSPELVQKKLPLKRLAMGSVVKVILRFNQAFWFELDEGRYRQAAFFQAADAAFPTIWTSLPFRTPLLVAWAGGPKAQRLSALGRDEVLQHALRSVQRVFGKRTATEKSLEAWYTHDWQRDPLACGAYTYPLAGPSGRKALARPIADTLFFAGEATEPQESASVGGAVHSGQRAARELLGGGRVRPGR
jgi:monoamine oxidase